MLCRKEIEPQCSYCSRGRNLNGEEVVCVKHGVVSADFACRAFSYDPLKRIPPRPVSLQSQQFHPSDFSI